MEKFKKIINAFVFPHFAVMAILLPISVFLLIESLVFWGEDNIISYISYAVSAYTLSVFCFRIPKFIAFFKRLGRKNTLLSKLTRDPYMRVRFSLWGAFCFNIVYAVFKLVMAIFNASVLFYAIAAYYFLLALMRIYLLKYGADTVPGDDIAGEYRRYRICGIIMLVLNVFLGIIVTYTVIYGKSANYGMIVTIAMAAFAFTALSVAIVNLIRYRKYKSPIFNGAKNISLAVAVVSMLSLEDSMFAAFAAEGEMGESEMLFFRASTGFGIMLFVISLAVMMVVFSNRYLKNIKK